MAATLLFTEDRKRVFLECLEETCSPKRAAEAVGVSRKTAHHHKKLDAEFSKEWDSAIERAMDDLLGEAHHRATVEKSDRLLEVLLKFRYGDKLSDRLKVQVEHSTGLDADVLLLMDADDRRALMELLTKYAGAQERHAMLVAPDAQQLPYLEHDGVDR